MTAELAAQAAQWKASALAYRRQVGAVFEGARRTGTIIAWREALQAIRGLQDGVEEILAVAIIAKGASERWAASMKAEYEDRWAEKSAEDSRVAVRRGPEMEGPRERYARVDLAVFNELRNWRQAEQDALVAQEAEREIQVRYRAVNTTREDIHQILRAIAFESTLERT